jgi:hypothetical protein
MADTDSTVTVLWSPPEPQSQCLYQLYFRGVRDSAYTLLSTTTSTMSKHMPQGATGWYKVAAKFGSTVYESPTVLSTVPIHTDVTTMVELNADPGHAGTAGTEIPVWAASTRWPIARAAGMLTSTFPTSRSELVAL